MSDPYDSSCDMSESSDTTSPEPSSEFGGNIDLSDLINPPDDLSMEVRFGGYNTFTLDQGFGDGFPSLSNDPAEDLLLPLPSVIVDTIDGTPNSLNTGDASEWLIQDQESTESSTDTVYVAADCHGDRRRRSSKHVWTKEEDERLLEIVKEMKGLTRRKFWPAVVKKMGCHMNIKQVREHYKRLTGGYKKSKWSEGEVAILQRHTNGELTLEEVSCLLNRNAKQIKERIAIEMKNKSPWSKQELEDLKELVAIYGNKYSMIHKMMKGRGYDRTYQQIRCKVIALLKHQ